MVIYVCFSKESSLLDISSTENMVAMTQLKEEVESLKKQLLQKQQEILERDKKVYLEAFYNRAFSI